jgi:hypothetical protein
MILPEKRGLSPGAMQKAPCRMTGPFGRFSLSGGCSLPPPPSQFVTLSFGSRAARVCAAYATRAIDCFSLEVVL